MDKGKKGIAVVLKQTDFHGGRKALIFTQNPIVYKCDPNKNTTCAKTACQKQCQYTLNPYYSADGKRYRLNDDTNEIEELDG